MLRFRVAALTAAALAALAGCGSNPATTHGPLDGTEMTFHDSVVRAIDEAKAEGADDAQLAILDATLASGEVTLEDARRALDDYGACLEGAGLALVGVNVVDDAGFMTLDYSVRGAGEDTSVMDACYAKTFQWVDMLYRGQPAAIEARDATFDAALPALIECLQAGGVPVDADAPADEVKQVMIAFMREHMPKAGDPGVTEGDDGSLQLEVQPPEMLIVTDCLHSVDLHSF